jgi:hypothetical protein
MFAVFGDSTKSAFVRASVSSIFCESVLPENIVILCYFDQPHGKFLICCITLHRSQNQDGQTAD